MIEDDESLTLRHDVQCVILGCHRDRGLAALRPDASREELEALATVLARELAPRIGGRYIPKRAERSARDAAIWEAFKGNNHAELMRRFGISRRLLYSILARRPRGS